MKIIDDFLISFVCRKTLRRTVLQSSWAEHQVESRQFCRFVVGPALGGMFILHDFIKQLIAPFFRALLRVICESFLLKWGPFYLDQQLRLSYCYHIQIFRFVDFSYNWTDMHWLGFVSLMKIRDQDFTPFCQFELHRWPSNIILTVVVVVSGARYSGQGAYNNHAGSYYWIVHIHRHSGVFQAWDLMGGCFGDIEHAYVVARQSVSRC